MPQTVYLGHRPIEREWHLQRNTTQPLLFVLADTDNAPIDLTDASFQCYVKASEEAADTDALYDWPVTTTDAENGAFQLGALPLADTIDEERFPDKGYLLLYFNDAAGNQTRLMKGPLIMEM